MTATGINRGTNDPPPSLSELSAEIVKANAGNNPSNGWVATTVGSPNTTSTYPWGARPGIDAAARWTWYDSHKDSDPGAPFVGFNHDEYLIFRIPAAASPTPEPSSWVIACTVGTLGMGLWWKRSSRPSRDRAEPSL